MKNSKKDFPTRRFNSGDYFQNKQAALDFIISKGYKVASYSSLDDIRNPNKGEFISFEKDGTKGAIVSRDSQTQVSVRSL